MARYRKVDPRIWSDAKFNSLPDKSKLVFVMLLTHQNMTQLGAMRAALSGLSAELGWSLTTFRRAFLPLIDSGVVKYDTKSLCLWLPNFLNYNQPESPNVVRSWAKSLALIPECKLLCECLDKARQCAEGLGVGFGKAFREALGHPLPNQEQEQEQEPEQEQEQEPPLPPTGGQERAKISEPVKRAQEIYRAYPRKVAVGAAHVAIGKAVKAIGAGECKPDWHTGDWPPDDPVAWLKTRVVLYAASPAVSDLKFVPHCSTWMNQRRFCDDPSEWNRPTGQNQGGQAAGRRAEKRRREFSEDDAPEAAML